MTTRSAASGRSSRTSPGTASGRGPRGTPRVVFLFSGQSNMSAYSQSGILRDSSYVLDPSLTHTTPPLTVPDYARTALNEWQGAPPASTDSGVQYPYPTLALAPCLYAQAVNVTTYHDSWGAHVGSTPDPTTGVAADSPGYGLEMTFLYRHLASYPSVPLACIKASMGGSSLGDWTPADTGVNAGGPAGPSWPTLKGMVDQATARLDASGQPWRWGAFVWMQGESGAYGGQTDDSAYLSGCRAFFAAVRSLTRPDLPVLVGEIGDNWGWNSAFSGDTARANPFLRSYSVPYAVSDYSAGGTATQARRDADVASAYLRRLTQRTLGSDANCASWNNDGYPCRPPYLPGCESANNDNTGFHWAGPGNMAAGERAFAAYQSARD